MVQIKTCDYPTKLKGLTSRLLHSPYLWRLYCKLGEVFCSPSLTCYTFYPYLFRLLEAPKGTHFPSYCGPYTCYQLARNLFFIFHRGGNYSAACTCYAMTVFIVVHEKTKIANSQDLSLFENGPHR